MAKGKRATNEELCIRYNKERSNLYSSRTRLRKQLAKATVKKEITSINKKINTKHIDYYNNTELYDFDKEIREDFQSLYRDIQISKIL